MSMSNPHTIHDLVNADDDQTVSGAPSSHSISIGTTNDSKTRST
jgi:hypothetical protein